MSLQGISGEAEVWEEGEDGTAAGCRNPGVLTARRRHLQAGPGPRGTRAETAGQPVTRWAEADPGVQDGKGPESRFPGHLSQ